MLSIILVSSMFVARATPLYSVGEYKNKALSICLNHSKHMCICPRLTNCTLLYSAEEVVEVAQEVKVVEVAWEVEVVEVPLPSLTMEEEGETASHQGVSEHFMYYY